MKAEKNKKKSKTLYKIVSVGFAIIFAISSVAFAINVFINSR